MKIVVPIKLVPDLVEELVLDARGTSLDRSWLNLILNEYDNHAMEQALLLKQRHGAHVTVIAPDVEGIDDTLFTAAARGVDRITRLTGNFEPAVNNHGLARLLAPVIEPLQPDLVLIGVQAHDDLDGAVGPLLAHYLEMPYVSYIAGVAISGNKAMVRKEYSGGVVAQMEVTLPAVLGIQAAEQSPQYVPISKIRQAMKTAIIETLPAAKPDCSGGPAITRLYAPEVTKRATMIEGDETEIITRLMSLFKEAGIL
jgi:electron transfer flavoprotein beta subunit